MKKILLFLSNGFETLEAAPFIDVFGWNNTISKEKVEVITTSLNTTTKASWDLKIIADSAVQDISPSSYEALVIPGGFGRFGFFNDFKDREVQELINNFFIQNKYIIGICTGAIPLAELGILKGKNATTYLLENDRYFKQLSKNGAIPVREKVVVSQKIITSSFPSSATEVAFKLLELLTSKENADFIRIAMGY